MTQTKRALMLIADRFQDEEGTEPIAFLRDRGIEVVVAGLKPGTAQGKNGRAEITIEVPVTEVRAEDFDLLILPGGAAPEALRLDEAVLDLTRAFLELPDKTVAAICHGPQILISAGVLPGRTATCFAGIRDDLRLAGARYVDRKVCVDGRLITSRVPGDLPAFHEAIAAALALEEPAPAGESGSAEAGEEDRGNPPAEEIPEETAQGIEASADL